MHIQLDQQKKLSPIQAIVLSFFLLILLGTFLLMLPFSQQAGEWTSFITALFTSASAVCVTGLSVVETGTYWSPFGQVIIMLLIQFGGLGFMTMTTTAAILLGKRIGLRNRILMQEALNQFSISGVIRLTKYVFIFTLIIQSFGFLLMAIRFVPEYGLETGLFYSLFHSISAFCNAGFDLIEGGGGMTHYVNDPLMSLTLMALFILGGLGFSVLADFYKTRKWLHFSLHTKFVLIVTGILILIPWVITFFLEMNNPQTLGELGFIDKIIAALFLSTSPRTAGFNTVPTESLRMGTLMITMALMFIGGSSGSTAGGIKTTTFGIMILTIITVIKGREDVEFINRRISKQVFYKATAVIFISTFIISIGLLLLTILEPHMSFQALMFETFSAFGTTGLSMGITEDLSSLSQLLLTVLMFFGRLGPLTIVLSMSSSSKKKPLRRYPEGRIIVG